MLLSLLDQFGPLVTAHIVLSCCVATRGLLQDASKYADIEGGMVFLSPAHNVAFALL
jgi:hypothetical protein